MPKLGELFGRGPSVEEAQRREARQTFARIRELAPQFSDRNVRFDSATLTDSIINSTISNRAIYLSGYLLDITEIKRGNVTSINFNEGRDGRLWINGTTGIFFDPVSLSFRGFGTEKKGIKSEIKAGDQDLLNNLLELIREDLEQGRKEWVDQLRTERGAFLEVIRGLAGSQNLAIVQDFIGRTRETFTSFILMGLPLQGERDGEQREDGEEKRIDSVLPLVVNDHLVEEQAIKLQSGCGYRRNSGIYTRHMEKSEGSYEEEFGDCYNHLSIRLDVSAPSYTARSIKNGIDFRMEPTEKMFYAFMAGDRDPGLGIYKPNGEFVPATLLWAEPNKTPVGPLFE